MSDSTWKRLRRIWRPSVRDDVDDEMMFHFEMRVRQFMDAGMSRPDAERAARDRFGDVTEVQSELVSIDSRRRRKLEWRDRFGGVWQDVVVSLRTLRREPLFTAGVVLTLGLGIGANATMFAIIDRLMLRGPAHVVDASAVRRLYITIPRRTSGFATFDGFGYVTYTTLRDQAKSFSAVAAYSAAGEGRFGTGADARSIQIANATWDLFPLLGVRTVLGRFYSREEDSPPRGADVAVISEEMWQSEFGGDPAVIGKRIVLNDVSHTVIGVAPAGFTGPERVRADVWLPMTLVNPRPDWPTTYQAQWLRIVTRLAPGASPDRAGVEATTMLRGAYAGPEARLKKLVASIRPLWFGDDGQPSPVANVSRWLMGVAVVVLLVTCANVANLLVARGRRRRREVAVRLALGAGRARLVRLLLTETLLVVFMGAGAALLVAIAGARTMRATLLSSVAWDGAEVDVRLFLFTFVLASVTGLLVGLAPAIDATRANLTAALKSGAGEGGGQRARVRTVLSALQTALCVVLLIGAGLFVHSLARSRAVNLGFDASRIIRGYAAFRIEGITRDERAQSRARVNATLAAVLDRLRAQPWVENAALSVGSPFGYGYGVGLAVPGRDSIPQLPGGTSISAVTPSYFSTVGTPLRAGRVFTPDDRAGSAAVVIVGETMAKAIWPNENPLGKCLMLYGDPGQVMPCTTVVGVVADVHKNSLREPPSMQYYVPVGQEQQIGGTAMLVRVRGDAASYLAAFKQAMLAMPDMPYVRYAAIQESIDPEYRPWKLGAAMFGVFGVLALVIAAVGLYSVIAYLVADRTRELGVRIALGATGARIVRDVVSSGLVVTAIGAATGVGVALLAGRFVEPLLFDGKSRDPIVLSSVVAIVLVIAVFAAWWPARRASRVDPVVALRAD